ncbi:MAG: phenylacetate--CoA ligase [Fibrobacter sp.]|nr:phenylacetate--CoA ligase [Fibrobacter sp.]
MRSTAWNDEENRVLPEMALDFMPEEKLRDLQLQRLRASVKLAYEKVPLFRERMDEKGTKPEDIKTLKDIVKVPFSMKKDLRDTYPYGLFAVDLSEVVRLHASSGTTGKPIVVGYTKEDMEVWAQVVKRGLLACGFRSTDIVQNFFGYGLFTGGMGIHGGFEALGATVIPISGGNTERQVMLMKDFGVTALAGTPSYFLRIMDVADKMGISIKDMGIKRAIFGAEPWSDGMRDYIEEQTGIKCYDIYGLSEIVGPGVGCECEYCDGMHIFEDHFYPEIVDPETLEPLPDGQEGELVISTLSKRAMPILRYRTRDITAIETTKCKCGRTIRRIRRIGRRTDDMIIMRGVNVFPSQIETALLRAEKALPHYQIVLDTKNNMDTLEVKVEVTRDMVSDSMSAMEQLSKKFKHSIEQILGISVIVTLCEPDSLPRSEGKAKRVIDNRKKI